VFDDRGSRGGVFAAVDRWSREAAEGEWEFFSLEVSRAPIKTKRGREERGGFGEFAEGIHEESCRKKMMYGSKKEVKRKSGARMCAPTRSGFAGR